MKIFIKYILREHIPPFIYGLSTIIFIFMMNLIFRDLGRLMGKGLPAGVILEFFMLNIAWILALAIPMGVLIASLSVFGRLSGDNEITALKASGVNLYRLIFPVLIAAAVLALGMERFNNLILPDFNYRASMLMQDISRKRPTITLEPHIFFDEIPNYSILVHKINERTGELQDVLIHDNSNPRKNRTILAKEGALQLSEKNERMVLTLKNGVIHETGLENLKTYQKFTFEKQVFTFALDNAALKRSSEKSRGRREKTTAMMKAEIARYRTHIEETRETIRSQMMNEMQSVFPGAWMDSTGMKKSQKREVFSLSKLPIGRRPSPERRVETLISGMQSEMNMLEKAYQRSIRGLQVEIEKKKAIPVACIVFVLIGAPLGVMAHQGGMTAWVFSLIFFLLHWSFLIGGEQLADRDIISPWIAMWSANIVVGGFGVFMVIQTVRETRFIEWKEMACLIKKILGRRK